MFVGCPSVVPVGTSSLADVAYLSWALCLSSVALVGATGVAVSAGLGWSWSWRLLRGGVPARRASVVAESSCPPWSPRPSSVVLLLAGVCPSVVAPPVTRCIGLVSSGRLCSLLSSQAGVWGGCEALNAISEVDGEWWLFVIGPGRCWLGL